MIIKSNLCNITKEEMEMVTMEFTLIIIAYTAWSIYSGWKFMSGKIGFLEQPGVLNIVIKS